MTSQDSELALEQPTTSSRGEGTARRASFGALFSQYFLMREDFERARRRQFDDQNAGVSEFRSAKQCLDAGQSLEPDLWFRLEGIAILRLALPLALDAWRARAHIDVPRELPDLWQAFSERADHSTIKPLTAQEQTAIDRFVNAADILYVSALNREEREFLGRSLFHFTRRLVISLERESVSIQQLRATRLYRMVLAPLALLTVLMLGYWWAARSVNLAFEKHVTLSSSFQPALYPAAALVNGDTQTLGIHTMNDDHPWAQIDLGSARNIRRVVVFNRQNVRSNSVPLQIETSVDGKNFKHFASQAAEFSEWKAEGKPVKTRYVRLTVTRLSSLQLAEVEVY